MLLAAAGLLVPLFQDPTPSSAPSTRAALALRVELHPASGEGRGLSWSPKGATVPLTLQDGALAGAFELGPYGVERIAVRLEKSSPDAAHFDVLRIDLDRDGKLGDAERFATEPKDQRGKWWSSFTAVASVPVPAEKGEPAGTRPYPLSLWYVEDPKEPDQPKAQTKALRWSRRGWHEGEAEIDGKPAFVMVTEMQMDGVFDRRDSWAIARDREALLKAPSKALGSHVWLDGSAYRATRIDPHGKSLALERFDPGTSEAEEKAKADVYAPDRAAPRAAQPLAFGKDLAAALARAKAEKKLVLVDFETTWCGPCKLMDQIVYTAAPVVDAARGVLAVKLDGDEQRDLVKRYGVTGYPTILLLDGEGSVLTRKVGYQSVAEIVRMLPAGN